MSELSQGINSANMDPMFDDHITAFNNEVTFQCFSDLSLCLYKPVRESNTISNFHWNQHHIGKIFSGEVACLTVFKLHPLITSPDMFMLCKETQPSQNE